MKHFSVPVLVGVFSFCLLDLCQAQDGSEFTVEFTSLLVTKKIQREKDTANPDGKPFVIDTFQRAGEPTINVALKQDITATIAVGDKFCTSRLIIFQAVHPIGAAGAKVVGTPVGKVHASFYWGIPTVMITRRSPNSKFEQVVTGYRFTFTDRNPEVCVGPTKDGEKKARLPKFDVKEDLSAQTKQLGTSTDFLYVDPPGLYDFKAGEKLGHREMKTSLEMKVESMTHRELFETYITVDCESIHKLFWKVSWGQQILMDIKAKEADTVARVVPGDITVTTNPDSANLTAAKGNGNFDPYPTDFFHAALEVAPCGDTTY